MKYLLLLSLVACGSGNKGGASSASSGTTASFVPACNNGGLNGTYETVIPGTPSVFAVNTCNFTFDYGNGCEIDGTISNDSNDGPTLTATLTAQSGPCGGISSGTCTFSRTVAGVNLDCDSLYIDAYFEKQ